MAVAPILKYITVPATTEHTATVIFIHGLGDTGHGWRPIADMFKIDPALAHVKWVLPHSPVRSVEANLGISMPSWFNIYSFGFNTTEDEEGMQKSTGLLHDLIKYEVESNGIDPSRIIIGGFSQGGTMALLAGLTGEHAVAGVACLSGWLPMRNKFKEMVAPHAAKTSVFYGHGSADPLVRMQQFEDAARNLVELGIPRSTNEEFGGLYYHVYEGLGHCTVQKELDDLKRFIERCIPADTSK